MMLSPQQKPRNNDSQTGALNIFCIQKYLILLQSPTGFNDFYIKGPLKFKAGFLNYRDWLLKHELITQNTILAKTIRVSGQGAGKGRPYALSGSIFIITEKGRQFLEMLK